MSERTMGLGVLQVGGIQPSETRRDVVGRLLAGMREAHARGADFLVMPELTLTTFFPRYWVDDLSEVDRYFERGMPNADTMPLFEAAQELSLGFCLGYAELTDDGHRFNTAITVDRSGAITGKYRKIHLPGHADNLSHLPTQHLEKRYFEVGDLGFGVFSTDGALIGMAICNDRRWPEAYRVLSLQSAEIIAIGYNTPTTVPGWTEEPHTAMHAHMLCLQAGAYQNSVWVAAAAKSGTEDGAYMIGGSAIVSPAGEIVCRAATDEDEVLVARIDLDFAEKYRTSVFDYAAHRRVEAYSLIVERTGRGDPL
jgi:predicted amidohydrolase